MTHEELNELLEYADAEIKNGNYVEAEIRLRKIIAKIESVENAGNIHGNALVSLSVSLWRQDLLNEALPYLQRAFTIAKQEENKILQAKTFNNFGIVYGNLANYPLSLEYFNKALEIQEQTDNKKSMALTYGNIGVVYQQLSEYQKSVDNFCKALTILEAMEDKHDMARNLGNLGTVYGELSDYSSALKYLYKALAISEELDNKLSIERNLGNIGIIYQKLTDYSHALEYYKKSLAIAEELGANSSVARHLSNIGAVYSDLLEYSLASEYFNRALLLNEDQGRKNEVAKNLGNIGSIYQELSDSTRALEYFNKSLAISMELGSTASTAVMLGNIGSIYSDEKFENYNPAKSEEFLLKAITICENIGIREELYDFHNVLSELYANQQRWQEAFEHNKKYHELKKEIMNQEVAQQAHRFAVERDMAVMQREKEVLRVKNMELADLNVKLELSNNQLIKFNVEKNLFLGIAAHDLKNPLSAITMISTILEQECTTLTEEEVKEFSSDIRKSSKQMFDLIVNLLDVNKIERGATLPDIELFVVGDYIRNVVARYAISAQNKAINLVVEIDDSQVQNSPTIFMQVLDNLISNAIKFSPFGTSIFIRTESTEKLVKILIQDEGPGLTDEDKQKLFGQFTRLSAQPTGGEHSSGLGLSIVKRLVEMMNGKIWCESEAGKGATFIVELQKGN